MSDEIPVVKIPNATAVLDRVEYYDKLRRLSVITDSEFRTFCRQARVSLGLPEVPTFDPKK